jgi:uncharacterized protein
VGGLVPVVLILAGSGPTDRDGNSPLGRNDAYKLLAAGLTRRGIASLRYDKRGIGASAAAGPDERALRFDTYVGDAVAWVRELRAQHRFSRIAIAGHSEGSLIGMLAAAREPVDAYVSLEGAGRPAPVVLREQLRPKLPPELLAQSDRILDALVAGRPAGDVPPALDALYRPAVQPYLISWFRYDPVREIASVRAPVAIVQGTADVQVGRVDADALHAGTPAARFVVVNGMNHVLKHVPDTSSPSAILAGYTDPSLPVVETVIDTVAELAKG